MHISVARQIQQGQRSHFFHIQQHHFLAEKGIGLEAGLAKGEKLLFSYCLFTVKIL